MPRCPAPTVCSVPGAHVDGHHALDGQHGGLCAGVPGDSRRGSSTGPIFGYSDTWQLVINTGTTIVTFLMVFLIQRAQNKDSMAIQLKLNELVAAVEGREQPA